MDRQQTTGFILLTAMLIAYFVYFGEPPVPAEQQGQQLSGDTLVAKKDSSALSSEIIKQEIPDSILQEQFGFFALGKKGEAQSFVLENEDVKITFNSQGGTVQEVMLKKHVSYDKSPLVLIDEKSNKITEEWLTKAHGSIDFNSLYYQGKVEGNRMVFTLGNGESELQRVYTLDSAGYVLHYGVEMRGLEGEMQSQPVSFHWTNRMKRVEKDLPTSRMRTTVNYYMADESFDNLSETSSDPESEKLEQPAKWVSMKQKFFNSAIITDRTFTNVTVGISPVAEEDTASMKIGDIDAQIAQADIIGGAGNVRYYFGPNDLDICKEVAPGFDENVYLGWAIFVPISRFLIIPFFQLLEGYITNYGIIILILVFVVKMALFPLTYKSYLSMAKSRVLKPEMDKIKEEHGEDMQKIQQETLKMQSQFGVNPLSGCIPLLAQSPILFALFTFFPNAIQLRQESFLWADDLSTYDSILDLPFTIPMYGDHVSLFTLLMTAVTLVNTFYNNQMNSSAASMQGPMKYMGYVMPVMFLFFLNSYSSGLTYYYFLSTSITVIQMVVSKQFIDEDKIRMKLEENRQKNKGKKAGGFMSRMEQALRDQEQARKEGAKNAGPANPGAKGAKNLKGRKRK